MSRKRLFVLALLTLIVASTSYATEKVANHYKTHKLSPREVLVTCDEDASPTVDARAKGFVIVSCPHP